MGGTSLVMMPPLGFYWGQNLGKIGKQEQKHTYILFAAESPLNSTICGQSATAYAIEASALILTENIYQIL